MPWDQNAPHPCLAGMRRRARWRGRVLVPGCGRGHDLVSLAEALPGGEVTGIDIAPAAVERVVDLPVNASARVGDLFDLGDDWAGAVDLVWEHTCFCAIDPSLRAGYRDAMARLIKPGGKLVGVFFLTMVEGPGGGPPHNTEIHELVSLFSPEHGFRVRRLGLLEATFPQRVGEEWLAVIERLG
ncbi:methyltransferase domain-containing protein [Sulfuriroseicoccus oceanibius]|uniref:Methyltransferase domain-containing protein n=2 Tax=Sulfuriroseicoccus oceanibius TaxID=2707525 RepID=A0A6B3LAX7_9BACT|nr:methyltransferase domain-containing protein [Sulfuriroseicoccus oceanibius]